MSKLITMPSDIFSNMLTFLDARDILNLRTTSTAINDLYIKNCPQLILRFISLPLREKYLRGEVSLQQVSRLLSSQQVSRLLSSQQVSRLLSSVVEYDNIIQHQSTLSEVQTRINHRCCIGDSSRGRKRRLIGFIAALVSVVCLFTGAFSQDHHDDKTAGILTYISIAVFILAVALCKAPRMIADGSSYLLRNRWEQLEYRRSRLALFVTNQGHIQSESLDDRDIENPDTEDSDTEDSDSEDSGNHYILLPNGSGISNSS